MPPAVYLSTLVASSEPETKSVIREYFLDLQRKMAQSEPRPERPNPKRSPAGAQKFTDEWDDERWAQRLNLRFAEEPRPPFNECKKLWLERAGYYKEAGYCFKSSSAISLLGNTGCRYSNEDSVPLSTARRDRIAEIYGVEKRLGCRGLTPSR
jgi:hypothetical protein